MITQYYLKFVYKYNTIQNKFLKGFFFNTDFLTDKL